MRRSRTINVTSDARRGGAVIIVVLALLTSLLFIGVFFYQLSDSELNVSRTFAQSPDQIIDPDVLGDFILQQTIVGPPAQYPLSALSGGQVTSGGNTLVVSDKSLLAHEIGLVTSDGEPADVRPRNGRGIGVYATDIGMNPYGLPQAALPTDIGFDFDGDGLLDAGINGTNFQINLSSLANDGAANYGNPFERIGSVYENSRPDVDYTYPDINSPFLAYETTITSGTNTFRVLIPSYFRPQLFPAKRNSNFSDIYTDPLTAKQVLRPHAEHYNSGGTRRYVTAPAGVTAQSGDRNRVIAPFPFTTDINGGGVVNQMGAFSTPVDPNTPYELDVDADGDGILDSIWLDLGHPLVDLADGRQAVPIFYTKIIDADALLNVNYHGQDPLITALSNNGVVDPYDHIYSLTGGWIHASNLGASVFEVNPQPALRADPNDTAYIAAADVDAATKQQQGWYSGTGPAPPFTFTRVQMSNTELARLLHGGVDFRFDLSGYANTNPGSDTPGRYGEVGALRAVLDGTTPILPSAGDTGFDDDGDDNNPGNNGSVAPDDNYATGVSHQDDFGGLLAPPLTIPPSVHPLDFTGLGNYAIDALYPSLALPYGPSYRSVPGTGGLRDVRDYSLLPTNPSRWLLYGTQTTPPPLTAYQSSLWASQDNGTFPVYGISPWTQAANPGELQVSQLPIGSQYDGLWNEADEIVTDGNFPTAVDAPFATSEMLALHPSDQQWELVRENSRLRKLMNFNLEANRQAAAIRQQFTTDSRDRLETGHSRAPELEDTNFNGLLDPNEDDGNATAPNDDADGVLDVGPRYWEFNDVVTGQPRFPPAFGGITSRHEGATPPSTPPIINVSDPFRPVTRRLLTIDTASQTNIGGSRFLPGQRLNINRLLVNFDRNGNPIYRHLTPHPTFQLADGTNPAYNPLYLRDGTPNGIRPVDHQHPAYSQSYYDEGQALGLLDPDVPANGTYPAVPFSDVSSDPFAAEVWARYDRQRLARDIYTLLYTVGAPEVDGLGNPFNPTTTPYTGADTNANGIVDTLEAMAQFAVNYVDALDHDDCITRFEFDTDLSDGWNNPPTTAATVFGVETQQIALSEVLLVQQPSAITDNDGTLHNENNSPQAEQRWLYMELRNTTPFVLPLQTGSYRLARYPQNETLRTGTTTPVAASVFTTTTSGTYKQIGPGENFLVACHDGQVTNAGGLPIPSDFYANIDDTITGLEAVIPENATIVAGTSDDPIMTATAPHADLDLIVTDTMVPAYSEFYDNVIPAPGGVALVETDALNSGTPLQFQLRLERRLNTNGFDFGENDGTWVEVDRFEVEGKLFLPAGTSSTEIQTALAAAPSTERRQPLEDYFTDFNDTTVVRRHSLISVAPAKHNGNYTWGATGTNGNDRTVGFTLWQPHFNRDFSSVYELLSIPVVGPDRLIRDMSDPVDPNYSKLSGWVDSSSAMPPYAAFAAAGIFLHPDGQTPASTTTTDDNRWYRLFEFLEYPPRTQETIRDGISVRRRTDGRLNLNTIRHEHVYSGLIDDLIQLNDTSAARPTIDRHDASRNWFEQLLQARDGIDPISNLPLPGVPGAMPFRSLSYIDPQPNGAASTQDPQLQNTIMRLHYPTGGASDNLQLLEARGTTDLTTNNVDYHTRNRLLAKIANNSTNRSHIFAMWVGYELFEAHQPNANAVQIGGRIEDLPGHREFVVVDMTRLEEAYVDDPATAEPGRFDFRKFIIYRKRIK